MPRPRSSTANATDTLPAPQTPAQLVARIEEFLADNAQVAVLEDGKVLFDLGAAANPARCTLSAEHDRCTLQLWSEEHNLVRQVVGLAERAGTLRLATQRFGHAQTKLLELVADRKRAAPSTRTAARASYLPLLERVLVRQWPECKVEGLRTSMDLEQSFGPAYARGSLVRGSRAWAIIAVNAQETATTMDSILTPGILWLHACRQQGTARQQPKGQRIYEGLRLIVPRGAATLTLSRLAWMNPAAAQWELWEFNQETEELVQRDIADQGNLRTRLVHHPDPQAAAERFQPAVDQVLALVPPGETDRVEQRLRSPSELAFLLHGLEFARARLEFLPNSFVQTLEVSVGAGHHEQLLTPTTEAELRERVAELFARRKAILPGAARSTKATAQRRIGEVYVTPAHARMALRQRSPARAVHDSLYRAQPERWLESVLRRDLAPLTRGLAPALPSQPSQIASSTHRTADYANDPDPDTIGNRADAPAEPTAEPDGNRSHPAPAASLAQSRILPRLDPYHVYAQVPAIAGTSDRGLLDLLGVTHDGRLAVIELKAADDLHFALQGLDYWIRVRHHHLQTADPATGLGEFQRHGYFHGVTLSPLPPRLYLVAPALHIHPATETVLRYLSPRVEWTLLALDERWRQQVKVVWRKQS